MTAAELERANLLPHPATVLSTAPGVVYFLVFEAGVGPDASPAQITAWVEGNGQGAVLGIARNGDAVGVCFKVAGGGQRTVQSTFLPLNDAPAFGTENLAIRFAVQGSDPRKLPEYVQAARETPEIDDGVGAIIGRAVTGVGNALPVLQGVGKWFLILLLLVALIVVVPRLLPSKA